MADRAKTPPPPKKNAASGGSRRTLGLTLLIAGVVAIVIAGALIFLSQRSADTSDDIPDTSAVAGVQEVTERFAGIPQTGAILGNPDAPVTIAEFADLRCPACKSFAVEQMPAVIEDLVKSGQAKYEYRLWPILGEDSVRASQAAISAQQQNKLFEYQDLWYINQKSERSDYATDAYVDGLAQSLGLDMAKFRQDRADEAIWSPEIQDVQVIAAQEGFGGTPAFVIKGPGGQKILTGSVPTSDEIAQAVQAVS